MAIRILIGLVLSFSVFAQDVKIVKVKGDVTFEGQKVQEGFEILAPGTIKTSPGSFAKIYRQDIGSSIVVGANSEMVIDPNNQSASSMYLKNGGIRWITDKLKKATTKRKGGISSRVASMGVRGTNFFVKVNKLLGETEIIVFEGKVEFKNQSDLSDKKTLTKNQWGGIGGRYGTHIGQVLDLPKNVIDHFGKYLNI